MMHKFYFWIMFSDKINVFRRVNANHAVMCFEQNPGTFHQVKKHLAVFSTAEPNNISICWIESLCKFFPAFQQVNTIVYFVI